MAIGGLGFVDHLIAQGFEFDSSTRMNAQALERTIETIRAFGHEPVVQFEGDDPYHIYIEKWYDSSHDDFDHESDYFFEWLAALDNDNVELGGPYF